MARRPAKPKPPPPAPPAPPALIPTDALCARLDISKAAVTKMRKRGLTPHGRDPKTRADLWDYDAVVAWRAANTLPSANASGRAPTAKPKARPLTERTVVADVPPPPPAAKKPSRWVVDGFDEPTTLIDADLAVRRERAQILYLQKRRVAGELVDADEVRRQVGRLVADSRRVFENLPKRAASAVCATLKVPSLRAAEVEAVLREHVADAMRALAESPSAHEEGAGG